MLEFYDPYQTKAVLEGVVPANTYVRPNWLQQWFPDGGTRETQTVNFDKEFMTRNTLAQFVAPRVDADTTEVIGYTTQEMRFAYAKEGIIAPDWEQLQGRQLGEDFFSQPDFWARYNNHLRNQAAIVEAKFENLNEYIASSLIFSGGYTVNSPKHPRVTYDFQRTKVTTEAGLVKGYVPETDLSTLVANGGTGKRAWNATGGTKAPTPYKDVLTAVKTCLRRSSVDSIVMSADAYEYLEADMAIVLKDAATLTLQVQTTFDLQVYPQMGKYQDLVFRRMLPIVVDGSGAKMSIPIYTYEAVYHDKDTSDILTAERAYVPNGMFAVLPSKDKGVTLYSRILHPKAQFQAMKRFINVWSDEKTGAVESEIHTNFLMGAKDIDAFCAWKVLA